MAQNSQAVNISNQQMRENSIQDTINEPQTAGTLEILLSTQQSPVRRLENQQDMTVMPLIIDMNVADSAEPITSYNDKGKLLATDPLPSEFNTHSNSKAEIISPKRFEVRK